MKKWYYLVKGQKQGPLDGIHISELVAAGVIHAETPIRAEHSADWTEFRDSELAGEDTPCRTINHLGRIGRCYKAMKVVFFFNFITVLPVIFKVISVYIERQEELKDSFRILYSVFDFALAETTVARLWLVLVTSGVISLIVLIVFWGILLYRMWLVIPVESRRISPAVLAVLSIVPVLSPFVSLWSVAGLSVRLTAQERREGVIGRRPSYNLCIIYCIVGIAALALPQIFLLFHYLIWIGVAKQLYDASTSILHQRLQEY